MQSIKKGVVWLSVFLIHAPLFSDLLSNHLEEQTSPYLRQHCHQPVDWYPWGEEAFEEARQKHKPIFLSIGYSTCHWCHVMAKESFEDPVVAALINRYFVAVKVDREEMPHLDRYFQRVYERMHHRHGGWPLTIFLTEEGHPFFSATYLPPEDSYGVKGLKTLLPEYGLRYKTDLSSIQKRAQAVEALLHTHNTMLIQHPNDGHLAKQIMALLHQEYDTIYHGWHQRPKFPESPKIRLLFDIWRLKGWQEAKRIAIETLQTMANSGLYDQIEGGFFRYCVDRAWRMPHFEKMLYTNAELLPLYLQGWQVAHYPRFKEVIQESVAQINQRFRTHEFLYMSASNADSDHQEGGYFLFRYDQALKALKDVGFSSAQAMKQLDCLAIEKEGNFDTELAHAYLACPVSPEGFTKAKAALRRLRANRRYPFIDRKIVTSLNGMMIEALFRLGHYFPNYRAMAQQSYRALVRMMSQKDGGLFHQTLSGHRPEQKGLLEDYSFMAAAALAGYQETLEYSYLKDAYRWANYAIDHFYRGEGLWLLASDQYIHALADFSDRYYTSALGKLMNVLLDLAALDANTKLQGIVYKTLQVHRANLFSSQDVASEGLRALLRHRHGIIVIEGPKKRLLAQRKQIDMLHSPFVLLHATQNSSFGACDQRSCFVLSDRLEEVLQAIQKYRKGGSKP